MIIFLYSFRYFRFFVWKIILIEIWTFGFGKIVFKLSVLASSDISLAGATTSLLSSGVSIQFTYLASIGTLSRGSSLFSGGTLAYHWTSSDSAQTGKGTSASVQLPT